MTMLMTLLVYREFSLHT